MGSAPVNLFRGPQNVEIPAFRCISVRLPVPSKYKNKISASLGQPGPLWARGWHTGTDYAVPDGTPLVAMANGSVLYAGDTGGKEGVMLKVRSVDGSVGSYFWYLMHLSKVHVKVGKTVKAGDVVGLSGNSGTFEKNASGSYHVHVQLAKGYGEKREYFRPVYA